MTTGCKAEATLGLMRQAPAAPSYLMEFMITRMAMELKAENFASLSLGMAPLAGLVGTPLSPRWHRMARLLWDHGEPIYSFRGLRSFKNKFRPTWEPRYLATAGAIGPFISLMWRCWPVAAGSGGLQQRELTAVRPQTVHSVRLCAGVLLQTVASSPDRRRPVRAGQADSACSPSSSLIFFTDQAGTTSASAAAADRLARTGALVVEVSTPRILETTESREQEVSLLGW
jgi:Phosphatidylglycerol lysyltransferase, C-terminal